MSYVDNKNISTTAYNTVVGDPWSVVPVKTRFNAKNTTEIELNNRKITNLVNFDKFENLEALWLRNNNLSYILNLETNKRLKILVLSNNNILTLKGSLTNMKFLNTLFVDNNKLSNLEEELKYLLRLPFLENLNLFNNPLSEEPQYRNRVIYNIQSVRILDRHVVTDNEKTKADKIVPLYNNSLNKDTNNKIVIDGVPILSQNDIRINMLNNYKESFKNSKSIQKLIENKILDNEKNIRNTNKSYKILMKISKTGLNNNKINNITNKNRSIGNKTYEVMSKTERELFINADKILKRIKNEENQLLQKKAKSNLDLNNKISLPYNKAVNENNLKYLKQECFECPELNVNEIKRIFKLYDPKNSKKISINDLDYCFEDIRKILESKSIKINENIYFSKLLDLLNFNFNKECTTNTTSTIDIKDIKKCFFCIIKECDINNKKYSNTELANRNDSNININNSYSSKMSHMNSNIKLPEIKNNKNKDNVNNDNKLQYISDIEYLSNIANIDIANNNNNQSINDNKINTKNIRKDIFKIKGFYNNSESKVIILNKNKLEDV